MLIPKGKERDVDHTSRITEGGADGLVVESTCVVVIVLGTRMTPARSLTRESAPFAYPEAPAALEALPAVQL